MRIFRRRRKDLFTIPEPVPAPDSSSAAAGGFRMVVDDCFFITGRGLIVTGVIEAGVVAVGDRVTQERAGEAIRTLEIGAIDHGRRMGGQTAARETIGLLLRGAVKGEIVPGDVLRTAP